MGRRVCLRLAAATLLALGAAAACAPEAVKTRARPVAAVVAVPRVPLAGAGRGALAVTLDQRRGVQAIDPIVARITFTISGGAIETVMADVPRAQFADGKAVARFDGLVPGEVVVDCAVMDAADRLLGQATSGSLLITAGRTADAYLTFSFASGSVAITLDGPILPTPAVAIGSGGTP